MSDDKSKTGGQDRARISVSEDYEVRDWAKKFGVTPEQLKAYQAGEMYVNVHSASNKPGEIRAQLKP